MNEELDQLEKRLKSTIVQAYRETNSQIGEVEKRLEVIENKVRWLRDGAYVVASTCFAGLIYYIVYYKWEWGPVIAVILAVVAFAAAGINLQRAERKQFPNSLD